ncbi:hypothetical protein [Streptomyces alfalfae]
MLKRTHAVSRAPDVTENEHTPVLPPRSAAEPGGSHLGQQEIISTAVEGTAVVTLEERRTAVSTWLLTATDDRRAAWADWRERGLTLLNCGGVFSAVKMPADLVWAAAGTADLTAVDDCLRGWFDDGGAVFMDVHSHLYYFLAPPSFAWTYEDCRYPGVGVLGRGQYVGVPAVGRTVPRSRAYWCVPMDGPGDLCFGDEVEKFLQRGRAIRSAGAFR